MGDHAVGQDEDDEDADEKGQVVQLWGKVDKNYLVELIYNVANE